MPSIKKTRKPAKTVAARSTAKAARAKSRMSKAPSAETKSKSGSASTSTRAGRAKSKSPATAKARAAARESRSAGSISGKNRSIARSAPKGSAKTGEVRSPRAKAASAKTSAAKTASAKTAAAKKASAKTASAAKSRSAKSARAAASRSRKPVEAAVAASPRASVGKVVHVSKKSTESRAKAAVHKEASPDISKVSPSKKATQHTQTMAKTNLKAVEPANASVMPASVKLHATPPAKPVPALAKTAPDPRPASHAPVMQPRETSEQNPVTQKKASIPSAAKAAPTPPAVPPEAPRPAAAKPTKPTGAKFGFKTNEHIVYPAHGVGQIVAIEEQEVAGFTLELFVISFIKDKMILKVPTPKVVSVGMRKLADAPVIAKSLDTLTGRARIKRTMWSRRAQEYEAKINSGDLIAIAEVVRDLYRSEAQPEQSYSERQLYEAALDRMGRELAVVQKLTEQESLKLIEAHLQKGPRRASKAEAEPDDENSAGDVDEAA